MLCRMPVDQLPDASSGYIGPRADRSKSAGGRGRAGAWRGGGSEWTGRRQVGGGSEEARARERRRRGEDAHSEPRGRGGQVEARRKAKRKKLGSSK